MNLLFPKISLRQFGWMLLFGVVGAGIAGGYGVIHDQVTFTLGPEYFTKFKFEQFGYLEREGRSVRWTVAQIGFLATWWVGFFAGWFMGRVAIPRVPIRVAAGWALRAVGGMMVVAVLFAVGAYLLAPQSAEDPRVAAWALTWRSWGLEDVAAFARVGYVHNASYLGGLAGLVGALIWLKRRCRSVS